MRKQSITHWHLFRMFLPLLYIHDIHLWQGLRSWGHLTVIFWLHYFIFILAFFHPSQLFICLGLNKIQNIGQLYREIHKYSPSFYSNQLSLNHLFEIENISIQAEMMLGFQSVWSLSNHLNLSNKMYQQQLHLNFNNLHKLLLI